MTESSWYKMTEGRDLAQGDIVPGCQVIVPQSSAAVGETVPAVMERRNVIVVSQSCDLAHGKCETVSVCRVVPLERFVDVSVDAQRHRDRSAGRELAADRYEEKKFEQKEQLRKGFVFNCHLLDKCSIGAANADFQVVDFRTLLGIPFANLQDFVGGLGERPRLTSPYREHLSQAIARFFMRVGLPSDIPPFRRPT